MSDWPDVSLSAIRDRHHVLPARGGSQDIGALLALLDALRDRVASLHLIEGNEPDHPSWYFDGWHDALYTVEDIIEGLEQAA